MVAIHTEASNVDALKSFFFTILVCLISTAFCVGLNGFRKLIYKPKNVKAKIDDASYSSRSNGRHGRVSYDRGHATLLEERIRHKDASSPLLNLCKRLSGKTGKGEIIRQRPPTGRGPSLMSGYVSCNSVTVEKSPWQHHAYSAGKHRKTERSWHRASTSNRTTFSKFLDSPVDETSKPLPKEESKWDVSGNEESPIAREPNMEMEWSCDGIPDILSFCSEETPKVNNKGMPTANSLPLKSRRKRTVTDCLLSDVALSDVPFSYSGQTHGLKNAVVTSKKTNLKSARCRYLNCFSSLRSFKMKKNKGPQSHSAFKNGSCNVDGTCGIQEALDTNCQGCPYEAAKSLVLQGFMSELDGNSRDAFQKFQQAEALQKSALNAMMLKTADIVHEQALYHYERKGEIILAVQLMGIAASLREKPNPESLLFFKEFYKRYRDQIMEGRMQTNSNLMIYIAKMDEFMSDLKLLAPAMAQTLKAKAQCMKRTRGRKRKSNNE